MGDDPTSYIRRDKEKNFVEERTRKEIKRNFSEKERREKKSECLVVVRTRSVSRNVQKKTRVVPIRPYSKRNFKLLRLKKENKPTKK